MYNHMSVGNVTIESFSNETVDVVIQRATHLLAGLEDRLPALGELYRDLHRHPELSMQERRTAGIVAQHLRDMGSDWVHLHLCFSWSCRLL
jgi:hypothetical protein